MTALLEVVARQPWLFYLAGTLVLFAFLACAATGVIQAIESRRFDGWLIALMASAVVVWRWPMLLWPNPLNIDEGYFTAGALKMTIDAVPWRGFDTATSGPLNSLVLALPALVGAPIDMFSSRVIALGLVIGTLVALYYAIRFAMGRPVAAAAIVLPTVFFALTTDPEFVHASTEHLPMFLTTAGLACLAYLLGDDANRRQTAAWAFTGLCAGSAAFAKLQAVPIAGMVLLLGGATVFLTRRSAGSRRVHELAWLAGGAATVPAIIMLSVVSGGSWKDFTISYLGASVAFIETGKPVGLPFFFSNSPWYTAVLVSSLLAIAVGAAALVFGKRPPARSMANAGGCLLLLAASLFAIYQPHRPWRHYLLFSVVPLSCCVAAALRLTLDAGWWREREPWLVRVCTSLFVLPMLSIVMAIPHPFLNPRPHVVARPQIDAIARHAPPGSRIAVWGWMPHYYVETGTIVATREAETIRQIEPGPYREFFRQRFLADLQAARPIAVVDAVAPGTWYFNDPARQGLETFPELHAYVAANYELKEEVDRVRIFVRKAK